MDDRSRAIEVFEELKSVVNPEESLYDVITREVFGEVTPEKRSQVKRWILDYVYGGTWTGEETT